MSLTNIYKIYLSIIIIQLTITMNLFCNSDFENYNMTTIINMSTFQYITYVKYISTDICWHTNSSLIKI